jgi:hypothetical protein
MNIPHGRGLVQISSHMNIIWTAIAALFFQGAAVAPALIQGVAVRAGTTEPLSKSVIELRAAEGNTEPYTATTTSDGKFAFRDVSPGKYRLTATRPGYVQLEYRQAITVVAGQKIPDIRFEMTQAGTIYGHVADRNGQPVVSATVQAWKLTYPDGQKQLKAVHTAITNDLGEYRLFWLPPGSYFVSAMPSRLDGHGSNLTSGADPKNDRLKPFGIGGIGQGDGVPTMSVQGYSPLRPSDGAYVLTYFSGSTDPSMASPIRVLPGTEFGSADLTINPVLKRHVRGVIMNGPTRQPNPMAQLRKVRVSAMSLCATASVDPDNCSWEVVDYDKGTFDVEATPGTYLLFAIFNNLTAQQTIEVKEVDLENVVLTLRPAITLPGRVTPPVAGVELKATPGPPLPEKWPMDGTSSIDGRFSIPGITPGDYAIHVTGLQGTYLKSIRLGNMDIMNDGLHLSEKPGELLEVTLGTNPGRIEGRALNLQGLPAVDATVTLSPDAALGRRADLYRTTQADAQGHYQFQDVAPGDYKLFAWEEIEPGAWLDRDFMRTYDDRGKPVRIGEGNQQTVDATVIKF